MSLHEWEQANYNTDRMRVPGGWLYRVIGSSPMLCFVPDPAAQPIEEPLEEDAPVVADSTDDVGVAS